MSASPKDESGSEGLLPAGEPLDTTGEAGGGDSTPPNVSSEDTTPPDDADPLLLGDAEIPEEGEKSMGDTAAETGEETVSGEGAAEPQYEDLLRELGNSTPLEVAGESGEDDALMLGDGAEQTGQGGEEDTEAPQSEDHTSVPKEEADTADPVPSRSTERDRYVLTINAKDRIETDEDRAELVWHEIRTSHINGRMLTGTLDGVEQTESGMTIVVVDYKGYRIGDPHSGNDAPQGVNPLWCRVLQPDGPAQPHRFLYDGRGNRLHCARDRQSQPQCCGESESRHAPQAPDFLYGCQRSDWGPSGL